MDKDLNTNIKSTYTRRFQRLTRGLMMASAMGVVMGDRLADKEAYPLIQNNCKVYKNTCKVIVILLQ